MINSLNILYEDNHILVCEKPSGIAVQSRRIGTADMESLLKNHIFREGNGQRPPYLAVIHRLDQPVRGILVFAKTPFSAKELNHQLTDGSFGKYYRALVDGIPSKPEGILTDYMIKNGRTNLSSICAKDQPGAKQARLGCPIVGDAKYNPNAQHGTTICLCAYKLEFRHPKTKKKLTFKLST